MRGMAALAKSWGEFEYHIKSVTKSISALHGKRIDQA